MTEAELKAALIEALAKVFEYEHALEHVIEAHEGPTWPDCQHLAQGALEGDNRDMCREMAQESLEND